MPTLPETTLMKIDVLKEDERTGTYIIEPLSPGYGVTLGNSLRRVLLSSLEGVAVSAVRIDGASHEFTTLPGMQEDVVQLILNLKTLRARLLDADQAVIRLSAKGPGQIQAKDFTDNANVELVDPDHYLATLDKQGKLSLEVVIERGRGYVPTEAKSMEDAPLGTISVDSIFTPVKKVHYEVEHTRVGGMTNFDKLTLDITTDGNIHPREALRQAATILLEHFDVLKNIEPAAARKVVVAKKVVTKKAAPKKTVKSAKQTKTKK